jgi:hypothetical protein
LFLNVFNFDEKEVLDAHGQVSEKYRKQPFEVQKDVEQAIEKKKMIGGCETWKIRKKLGTISKSKKCT